MKTAITVLLVSFPLNQSHLNGFLQCRGDLVSVLGDSILPKPLEFRAIPRTDAPHPLKLAKSTFVLWTLVLELGIKSILRSEARIRWRSLWPQILRAERF